MPVICTGLCVCRRRGRGEVPTLPPKTHDQKTGGVMEKK
uniref:Uncharacterized protein n=1 Tax=Anguilla anguilla TaxID=7936 RepID=A0A0E9SDY9_ANGAN